jgi:hypothetical protein
MRADPRLHSVMLAPVGAATIAASALRGECSELLQIKVMFEMVKRLVADLVTPMQSNQLGPPGGDRGKHNIERRGNHPGGRSSPRYASVSGLTLSIMITFALFADSQRFVGRSPDTLRPTAPDTRRAGAVEQFT